MERKIVSSKELFTLLQPLFGLEGRRITHLVLTLEANNAAKLQITERATTLDSDSEKWKVHKFNLIEAVETVDDGTDDSSK